MGERLAGGNIAIALLANTIATGAALVAMILAFGPISGAHLNPAVTLADAWLGGLPWREVPAYIAAQVVGAFTGVATAHVMFGLPLFSVSTARPQRARAGPSASSSPPSACSPSSGAASAPAPAAVPFAVGAYIIGRLLVHRLHLLRQPRRHPRPRRHQHLRRHPSRRCPPFVAAQLAGAFFATLLFRWLIPTVTPDPAGLLSERT